MTAIVFARTPDATDLAALRSYAIERGPKWKDELQLDWYHARADGRRGSILHGLRNNLGPSWLADFQFAEPIEWPNLRKMKSDELYRTMQTIGAELADKPRPDWDVKEGAYLADERSWDAEYEPKAILLWAARRERRRRATR